MNWISNYVRPKINSLFSRREVPENLWTKCPECGTMLFHRELADNLQVCMNCGHHLLITPRDRFASLFDNGIFKEVPVPEPITDPLQFRDQKKYPDRMKAAQKSTGEKEAMLVAEGEVGRTPIVAAAQDFNFMAGSMGMYVGNAIIAAAERAVALRRPLVLFSAAGGARMQEGILSLMQMPRTTVAVDCRTPPGADTDAALRRIHEVLGGEGYTLEITEEVIGNGSSADTPLMDAIRSFIDVEDPGARVLPTMLPAFTDSRTFRDAYPDLVAYGFFPMKHTTLADSWPLVHALSLIHNSEPTRPY